MKIINKLFYYIYCASPTPDSGSITRKLTGARGFFMLTIFVFLMDIFGYIHMFHPVDKKMYKVIFLPILLILMVIVNVVFGGKKGRTIIEDFIQKTGEPTQGETIIGMLIFLAPIVILLMFPWVKEMITSLKK